MSFTYKVVCAVGFAALLAGCATSTRPSAAPRQGVTESECQRMMSGRDTTAMSPEQRREMMSRCMQQHRMMNGAGGQMGGQGQQAPSMPYGSPPSGQSRQY